MDVTTEPFNIFWSNKNQNLVFYLEMCWFCFQNDIFFKTLLKLRRKLLFLGLDCSFGNLGLTSHTALFSSDTLIFYKHHRFFCADKDTSPILWSLCPVFFIRMTVIRMIHFFYKNIFIRITSPAFSCGYIFYKHNPWFCTLIFFIRTRFIRITVLCFFLLQYL